MQQEAGAARGAARQPRSRRHEALGAPHSPRLAPGRRGTGPRAERFTHLASGEAASRPKRCRSPKVQKLDTAPGRRGLPRLSPPRLSLRPLSLRGPVELLPPRRVKRVSAARRTRVPAVTSPCTRPAARGPSAHLLQPGGAEEAAVPGPPLSAAGLPLPGTQLREPSAWQRVIELTPRGCRRAHARLNAASLPAAIPAAAGGT